MAAEDIIFIAVTLFMVATGMFVVGYVGDTFVDNIVTKPVVNDSSYAVTAFNSIDTLTDKFDYIFLGAFIGLLFGVIVLSWFVPSHPIFYFAYMLVGMVSLILSSILANAWESITTMAKITAQLAEFPITNHIVSFLPLYLAVVFFVGITVMFAKPYMQGGEY